MKFKLLIISVLNAIFFPLVEIYWKIFKPKTFGSVCVIYHGDKILMIRHSYGRKRWGIPGGGIKKGEDPRDAAVREVKEEVGIDLKEVAEIGLFVDHSEYHPDTVYCFTAKVDDEKWGTGSLEISEGRWFDVDELPASISPVSLKAVELFKKTAQGQN